MTAVLDENGNRNGGLLLLGVGHKPCMVSIMNWNVLLVFNVLRDFELHDLCGSCLPKN